MVRLFVISVRVLNAARPGHVVPRHRPDGWSALRTQVGMSTVPLGLSNGQPRPVIKFNLPPSLKFRSSFLWVCRQWAVEPNRFGVFGRKGGVYLAKI